MTPPENRWTPMSATTPIYDQALSAVIASVTRDLATARDRLATPAEIAPLQQRLAALQAMRTRR